MKKELEVLKKYCAKMSTVQNENQRLKKDLNNISTQLKVANNTLNELGVTDPENAFQIDLLQEKLKTYHEIQCERNNLKRMNSILESELQQNRTQLEESQGLRVQADFVSKVVEERFQLRKKVGELHQIEQEVAELRRRANQVDDLEHQLYVAAKSNELFEDQLGQMRRELDDKCCEIKTYKEQEQKLRDQIKSIEMEKSKLESVVHEAEMLRLEKVTLERNIENLSRINNDYEEMCSKMECMESLKLEADMYREGMRKLEEVTQENEYLKQEAERINMIQEEKDDLSDQVMQMEQSINCQECEIKRLVCYIDNYSKAQAQKQVSISFKF